MKGIIKHGSINVNYLSNNSVKLLNQLYSSYLHNIDRGFLFNSRIVYVISLNRLALTCQAPPQDYKKAQATFLEERYAR